MPEFILVMRDGYAEKDTIRITYEKFCESKAGDCPEDMLEYIFKLMPEKYSLTDEQRQENMLLEKLDEFFQYRQDVRIAINVISLPEQSPSPPGDKTNQYAGECPCGEIRGLRQALDRVRLDNKHLGEKIKDYQVSSKKHEDNRDELMDQIADLQMQLAKMEDI